MPLVRVELCRGEAPGRLLRSFSFEECEGGAGSEFRGVHRGVLLQVRTCVKALLLLHASGAAADPRVLSLHKPSYCLFLTTLTCFTYTLPSRGADPGRRAAA